MYKIVDYSHLIISQHYKSLQNTNVKFIDATCGMGHDTLFMAKLLGDKGTVDAYDVQELAIVETKKLLKKNNLSNVVYYQTSFENVSFTDANLIIYNLGYLPNTDKKIKTTASSTIKSIDRALTYLSNHDDFIIVICVYVGHEEGIKESVEIDKLLSTLDNKKFLVSKYSNLYRNNPPYVLTICHNKKLS